ncbi:hypothetical protein BDY24DRAFT_368954 [Mrakia frigida]|uniref:uncharacterized protein n=1 Tax=Mrakia frigida TaxID=29902 RepID=UPI003FCBF05A
MAPPQQQQKASSQESSLFKADDDEFVFGSDDEDDHGFGYKDQQPHSVTYRYPALPSQSPLLSDAPLPPLQANYSFYNAHHSYEHEPLADQYRSTQLQSPQFGFGSPTFSEGESDASTTVSPRDVFADDHTAQKTYPSLFPNARIDSSSSTRSPHTPVDEQPFAHPSRLTSLRQESIESYSSYASTSSEDEDVPPTPLMIPEPKAHSHSYPKHVRASSNGTTLSPHMAFLATSPDGASSSRNPVPKFGFRPLETESQDEQPRYPGREDVGTGGGGESSSFDAVGSREVEAAAPSRVPSGQFDKKRASPVDDEDDYDDGDSRYHSSASDSEEDDDDKEYTSSRKPQKARRNSMASQSANNQQPKPKKKRVDPRNARRTSAGAASSSSATPAPREQSTPPEPTCWCHVAGCTDGKGQRLGFVRTYDLKRHEYTAHAAGITLHYCDTCSRTFSRKDALIRHFKTVDHSIPLHKRRGPGGGGGSRKR